MTKIVENYCKQLDLISCSRGEVSQSWSENMIWYWWWLWWWWSGHEKWIKNVKIGMMIQQRFFASSIFSLLQQHRPGLTDDDVPDRCSRFRDRDHLAMCFWLAVIFTKSITYCAVYFTEMQNATRFPTFSLKPEWLPTVGGFQRTVATFPDWGIITMRWNYPTWMVRNWRGCRKSKNSQLK